MAIMFPANQQIFAAESEREIYEHLRDEAPNDVRVYYSVSWNSDAVTGQYMGEGDFVILDPNFGFAVLEVKGGYKIDYNCGQWTLWESPSKFRHLGKSPYEQARASMHTLVQKYQDKYNEPLQATYAFAVCFPHYNVNSDLCLEINSTNTICQKDIQNGKLWESIRRVFFAHKHGGSCTENVVSKLDSLLKGETYTHVSTRRIVEAARANFSKIGFLQTACIDMLWNYRQVMIVGSAGTGKTCMAIQKARACAHAGMKTLYVCFNKLIASFVEKALLQDEIDCYTFHRLILSIVGEQRFSLLANTIDLHGVLEAVSNALPDKYDAIIVDEAQDFHEEWALTLRSMLVSDEESVLYVFYDEEQNIFHRNFGEAFLINNEPFLLRRNLRNTENIWSFVTSQTGLGTFSQTNGINGIDPKCYPTKNKIKLYESLTRLIRTLIGEGISPSSIVLLSDRKKSNTPIAEMESIAGYSISDDNAFANENELKFYTVQAYKGMDSEVVICLLSNTCSSSMRYVAYSRARCLLYVFEFNSDKY